MHGIGTLFYINGDRIQGTWVKDQLDGEALSIAANGTRTRQWYLQGQQVASEQQYRAAKQKIAELKQSEHSRSKNNNHELDELVRQSRGIPKKAAPSSTDDAMELMPMNSTSTSSQHTEDIR